MVKGRVVLKVVFVQRFKFASLRLGEEALE